MAHQDVALATSEELATGTAVPAEHGSGGLPQFDPTSFSSQLVWLALVFAVLYLVFSRISLPKIGGVIEQRNDQIATDRNRAETATREAESVMQAYEKSLTDARNVSSRHHADTAEAIKQRTETALKDFQSRADAQIAATEIRLNDSKANVMDEMHTIAAEIAATAAEKIVGIPTDLSAAKSVVQSVNEKLSKAA